MLTAWSLLVLITASHCNPLENGETVLAQNTNQNIPVDTNDNTYTDKYFSKYFT